MKTRYSQEEIESFAKGLKRVSNIVHSRKPDYIFAPVVGAVPFIDVLNIVDRHFPLESVEYPPNSSRFIDRAEIINEWYSNFLDTNYSGEPMEIICLDEVLSGSSASFGYTQFMRAVEDFSLKQVQKIGENERYRNGLKKRINYFILGIGENRERNHNFRKLENQKKAKVINLKSIITLDDLFLNPVRLKTGRVNEQGRQTYLPEVERFETTTEYLNFLRDIASYAGVNPADVSPVNISRIDDSLSRYLNKQS